MTAARLTPLILFFVFAPVSLAVIEISEIMYDPSGSDTNREWVEVHNTGVEVDFTKWKFFEANVNHGIASTSSAMFPSGGYAVIVQKKESFLADFPGFIGLVFDSSFSLINSGGEQLALKDESGNFVDQFAYDPSLGAAGDGFSLRKVGGAWVAGLPSPALENTVSQPNNNTTTSSSTSVTSGLDANPLISSLSSFPVEPKIFASAGKDVLALAGTEINLKGEAYGTDKSPLEGARFLWALGDGTIKEGKNISHIYRYPGKYVVVLDISSGQFSSSDRLSVEVIEPLIFISSLGSPSGRYVEIQNKTSYELDLGGWKIISTGGFSFTIPSHTLILPGRKLIFPEEVIGSMATVTSAFLAYPNGKILSEPLGVPVRDSQPVSLPAEKVLSAPEKKFSKEAANNGKEIVFGNSETLAASEVASVGSSDNGLTYWVIGLTAFLGVVAFSLRRFLKTSSQEADDDDIDSFEITEESV